MTGLTKAEEKKILSAADKITAGVELMVETPLHLIKCILMKHEKAVLEVMKELHERANAAEAKCAALEADAERYKFLCEGEYQDDGEMWTAISNTSIKDEWDSEIDAAIKEGK